MRAIFIDGGSLSWMREPLGIKEFENRGVYEVLVDHVGSAPLVGKPVYTISVEGADKVGKKLKFIGFELVVYTERGEDDRAIIDRIEKIDPTEVSEIVMVSADLDFAEALNKKAEAGVKIYWAATRNIVSGKTPMIGRELERILTSGRFEFVELANFKGQLMRSPWEERAGELRQPASPVLVETTEKAPVPMANEAAQEGARAGAAAGGISVVITFDDGADPISMGSILEMLGQMVRKVPGIKFKIESK